MEASPDYIALCETVAKRQCALGITVTEQKQRRSRRDQEEEYRDLDALVVRKVGDSQILAREPIHSGDFNRAAREPIGRF